MIGGNGTGSAGTLPECTRQDMAGSVGRYSGPADPHKAARFISDDRMLAFRGNRAALLRALISAGDKGVAHVEMLPWLLDAGAAVKALKDRGVRIETRRGRPARWILRSQVREVRP